MLPIDYFWSDVGSWSALPEVAQPDAGGNVITGGAELLADGARVLIDTDHDDAEQHAHRQLSARPRHGARSPDGGCLVAGKTAPSLGPNFG